MPKVFGICHTWLMHKGHHYEHLAVAAYSSCELLGFRTVMMYCSGALVILGIIGFIYSTLADGE